MVAWVRQRIDPSMATALTVTAVVLGVPDRTGSTLVLFDSVCMVGVCALVWWCHRFPISVAVGAGALFLASSLNSAGPTVSDRAVSDAAAAGSFLIALALGAQVPWARSLLGLLPLTAGLAITGGRFNSFLLMITVGPWLIGLLVASRQRAADQLERRARELAEEREAFAAVSVRYEWARIARELHDIVAHSMSLMVVQANAGAYLAGIGHVGASEAFDAISETVGQARAEIARLGQLLDTAHPAEPGGLGVVDELVVRARAAGLHVTYQVSGDVGSLLRDSIEAIHRVIQESITNALKHAPGADVTVKLHGGRDVVELTIHNSGGPVAGSSAACLGSMGGGHGTAGMRERIQSHGGDFFAGPDGHGGWDVTAGLPRRRQVPLS